MQAERICDVDTNIGVHCTCSKADCQIDTLVEKCQMSNASGDARYNVKTLHPFIVTKTYYKVHSHKTMLWRCVGLALDD